MKHSSFSFKIHKNERIEKEWGFYAQHLSCNSPPSHLQTWHPFHVYVKWVGYPLPLSHVIPMSFYTQPTRYSSSHPWWMMSVSSSHYCQVILCVVPKSLEIVCLEFILYIVLCTISHVLVLLSLLWSLNHLPLFHVDWWMIHQCLASTDFVMSTSTHHLGLKSRNPSVPWCL